MPLLAACSHPEHRPGARMQRDAQPRVYGDEQQMPRAAAHPCSRWELAHVPRAAGSSAAFKSWSKLTSSPCKSSIKGSKGCCLFLLIIDFMPGFSRNPF